MYFCTPFPNNLVTRIHNAIKNQMTYLVGTGKLRWQNPDPTYRRGLVGEVLSRWCHIITYKTPCGFVVTATSPWKRGVNYLPGFPRTKLTEEANSISWLQGHQPSKHDPNQCDQPWDLLLMPDVTGFHLRKPVTREMVQQLQVLTALAKDPGSVPRSHNRWLTAICNSSSRVSDTPCPLGTPAHTWCTPTHIGLCPSNRLGILARRKEESIQLHTRSCPSHAGGLLLPFTLWSVIFCCVCLVFQIFLFYYVHDCCAGM